MKKFFITTLLLIVAYSATFAQANILNPADPDVVFTASNHPAVPPYGPMAKWGHTARLGWNPFSYGYKSYYFKGMAFRVKFPKTYAHNVVDGKIYPSIIFLHGLGEPGDVWDNENHLVHGGQSHAENIDNGTFDGFMIYPQSQAGYLQNYFPLLKDLLDSMVKYVKLDLDRVNVGGLSSGGQAVWDFPQTQAYAKIAAGIEPISAAQYEDVNYFASHITIPVLVANGGQDVAPYPSTVTDIVNSYKSLGGDITQKLFPDQGHGAWNAFWADPAYWPFVNGVHKANPLIYFQHDKFCPNETVNAKLGLQAGYYAYEWQKDGVTIAGETSKDLIVTAYGSYRGRFKRTAASQWSAWSPRPAVIAQNQGTVSPAIQINGLRSIVLPAPDGSTSTPLMVPNTFFTYEWRRVSDNALVSSSNTYSAPVGQYKVKVTEQFGCSSDFSSIFTVVPANGSNAPDAASSVAATALSNSSIQLDWNDNPTPANNETAFEIYRTTTAGSAYTLVGKVGADILSFTDAGLAANKKYFYIIRAVNNTAASAVSAEVNATTKSDVTPPTAPGNLVVTGSTRSSVSLSWTESTDDIGVARYEIYVNGIKSYITSATTFTVNGLTALQTYGFFVKALDATGNISPASNQVSGTAALRGLYYKYYEGDWNALPDFNALAPVATGLSPNVTITPRLRDDYFGFLWEGYINIPVAGSYTFETNSDDGSRLYLGAYSAGATPLVDNDGLHGGQFRSGTVTLPAGLQPISMTFFEKGGGEIMEVYWTSAAAGIPTRTLIPNSAFTDAVTISPSLLPAKPSNLNVVATSYNKVNLSWTDNSTNESGFELSRSTTPLGTYVNIGSTVANVTTLVDSIGLAPNTKYWYKLRSVNQYGQSEFISIGEARWSFDNAYTDGSGNNKNLAGVGTPVFSPADKKEGTHSVSLNGSTQYIDMPFATSGLFPADAYASRTIALWIKPNVVSVLGTNKIVYDFGGSDNGISLRFNVGALQAGIARASTRSTVVVNSVLTNSSWIANGWNHVAVVYDGTKIQLFINSVLAGTTVLSATTVGTSANGSRIGANNGTNAFNSSATSTNYTGAIDDIEIIREPLNSAGILALMTQNYASDTTFVLPAMPATPTSLVSTAATTTTISLKFNDNSNNETSFEIYRSAANLNNYRLLATIPGASGAFKTYVDSSLFSNTNYYYKVRAIGIGGITPFTSDLLARTADNIPDLASVANFTMRYNSQKTLTLTATDLDGETLTYSLVNPLPAFASLTNVSNGVASILFNPTLADQGTYPISVVVSDGNGGKDTSSFVLTVNSNYTPVIASIANITIAESNTANVSLSATDQDGNGTLTWTLTSSNSFVTLTDNGNGLGSLTLTPGFSNAGVYPITVKVSDGAGGSETATFTLTVTNLEPPVEKWYMSMKYDSPNPSAPWNTIATPTTNNLLNGNGVSTPVGIQFLNTSWNAGNAGAVTGNNSGVYPDAVIKDYFWFGVYGAPNTVDVSLTGLTASAKYNVTLFGSSAWTGLGNNGTTIYTINGVAKPLYVDNNSQNTVTFSSISPDAQGKITVNMSKGAATPYGLVNAIVLEKPFNDGTAPAAPANLTGQVLVNGTVKLEWDDVAYNESNYSVYRATSAAGPFTLLSPLASANDTTYVDNTVLSAVTYYYKVQATNTVGVSGYSNTISLTTTNKAPLLADIADVYVKATNTATVSFAASDDPGDVLTTTVTGLPSFAVYQSTGNGAGNIVITPTVNDLGTYTGIVVTVTDNSGASVSKVFNLTVTDNSVRSVYLNFGPEGATAQGAPWNNFLGYPFANNAYGNIKDDANVLTGFTFKLLTQWNGGLSIGMRTGNNTGVFPDNVMNTSFHNFSTGNHIIQFDGLNPAKRYSIGFLTNNNTGVSSPVTFTNGAQVISVDPRYNTTILANLNGLVPNASGTIQVTITKTAVNPVLCLNGVVIREYNAADPVVGPADLFAETVLQTDRVKLTWSDRSSDETGFQIYRSTASNGTYTLIATTAANVTTYLNTGLTANTRYFYKVRSVRSATFGNYSNVANAILAANIVLVNLNYSPAQSAPAPWNNTSGPSTVGATFSNLINGTLINTGFEMLITKEFNGAGFAGVNVNGVFPANVMVSNYWTDAGQTSQVKFQNLDVSKKYRIGCFGSNLNATYATGNYTCNGRTVELNSYSNNVKVVYFDKLTPGSNGELVVSVNTASGSPYSFTGAYTIEYYDDNTPDQPVVNTIYPNGVPQGAIAGKNRALPAADIVTPVAENTQPATILTANVVDVETEKIKVFPNPFTSKIQVELQNPKAAAVTIMLYDMNGKMLFRSNGLTAMRGNNIVSANLPVGMSLAPGTYVINVWIDGKMSKSVKLIKVN